MKKTIWEKMLLLGLSGVLTFFSLSGCANGGDRREDILELTVWDAQGTDYTAQKMPEKLEDRIPEQWLVNQTGVQVTKVFGNGGNQFDSKLTQLMSDNDLPHLFVLAGSQGPTYHAKLNEGDLIYELTPEMLQKYAPHVWNTIPQQIWERIKVNDKIFGIPYSLPVDENTPGFTQEQLEYVARPASDTMFSSYRCFWVRDDILQEIYPETMNYEQCIQLLDKKNKPIGDDLCDIPIRTTEDYISFLQKIKALGKTEDGKEVFAFGYDGSDNWLAFTYFGAELMGYRRHEYPLTWNDTEKKLEMPILGDMVKEGALIQNRLLREGVIDPESLVHTKRQWSEKVKNGQYAVITMPYDAVSLNAQLEQEGKPYRYRPLYTQIPNKEQYPAFREPKIWERSLAVFKTVREEDLPKVLGWIDTMFTDEYEEIHAWGTPEAELYTEKNGKRMFKDAAMQKYYVERDSSALDLTKNKLSSGLFCLMRYSVSCYDPFFQGSMKYVFNEQFGAKFARDSVHVKNVKEFPPCKMQSPEYAVIPEVQEFWSSRSQWDDPFKLALTAQNDGEFEVKWQSAVDNIYEMTDVDTMLVKMTDVAKDIYDTMGK